jgi:hypothetical protein
MKNKLLKLFFVVITIFSFSSCADIVYLNETGVYLNQEIGPEKNEDWPNLIYYEKGDVTSVYHLPYFDASDFIDSSKIIGLYSRLEGSLEEVEVHECIVSRNIPPKDSLVSLVKMNSETSKEKIVKIEEYKPGHYGVITSCFRCGRDIGLDQKNIIGFKHGNFTYTSEYRVYELHKIGSQYEIKYLFYFIPEDRYFSVAGESYFYSNGSLNLGASFITKNANDEYKIHENAKVSFFDISNPLIEDGLGKDYYSTKDSVQLRVTEDAIYFISKEGEYFLCSKPKKQKDIFLSNIMKTGDFEYRINFVANSKGIQQSYAIYTVTGEVGKLSYPFDYVICMANRFIMLK